MRPGNDERRRERARKRLAHGGGAKRSRVTMALLGLLVLLAGLLAAGLLALRPARTGAVLALGDLRAAAAARQVVTARLDDEDAQVVARLTDGRRVRAAYPKSDSATSALITTLTDGGAVVSVDPQSGKATVRLLVTVLLPLIILADLFALLLTASRGGSSSIGEVVSFSKVGDKRVRKGQARPVGFADVGGAGEALEELREVVDHLRDPQRYADLGANPPKGVLLFGPPGTGKTLLAKAVAGEAGVPFFSAAGAEFVESLVGVGAARVRDLFARVRAVAPAIVFIDELDAAGRRRGSGSGGGSDEREQTLNQMLVEMDGFDAGAGIVVIAATNRPDILDPALLRPGRFDRHVTVDTPDLEGRTQILGIHAAGRPLHPTVDLRDVARRTPGFSGADLANVVNEAVLLAIRDGRDAASIPDLDEAVQRVLGGPRRRGHLMSEAERERVARHEAGHAVVVAALAGPETVGRVSVVARGRGITRPVAADGDGATTVLPRSALLRRLTTLLAGTSAEELWTGEISTGSEADLAQATALALDIAARYGMSEALGLARLLGVDADTHLDGTASLAALSPESHARLDREVRSLLEAAKLEAAALLERHRGLVDDLVTALLESETLEGEPLLALLPPREVQLPPRPSARVAEARPAVTAARHRPGR